MSLFASAQTRARLSSSDSIHPQEGPTMARFGLDDTDSEEDDQPQQQPQRKRTRSVTKEVEEAPPRLSINDDEDEDQFDDDDEDDDVGMQGQEDSYQQGEEEDEEETVSDQSLEYIRSPTAASTSSSMPGEDTFIRHASPSPSASTSSSSSSEDLPVQRRRPQPQSQTGSGVTPWPKTLGLEAKKVAVMQASLFGQGASNTIVLEEKEKEKERDKSSSGTWRPPALSFGSHAPRQPFQPVPAAISHIPAPALPHLPPFILTPLSESYASPKPVTPTNNVELAFARSSRVGWGPGGKLVHFGKKSVYENGAGRMEGDEGFVTIDTVRLFDEEKDSDAMMDDLKATDQMLQLFLQHTSIELDPTVQTPYISLPKTLRFAHFLPLFTPSSPKYNLFKLGSILFDEIDDLEFDEEGDESLRETLIDIRRKDAFSDWLEDVVKSSVEKDLRNLDSTSSSGINERILLLLSGHQIERACEAALEGNNVRLATLLAQIGTSDPSFREDIFLQLAKWKEYQVEEFLSKGYWKLFEVLCGNVRGIDSDAPGGLDWKRVFGLEFWYGDVDAGMDDALKRYEERVVARPFAGTATARKVPPPLPSYLESPTKTPRFPSSKSAPPNDPIYEFLKLYTSPTHPLEEVVLPQNFQSSPLNYQLSWIFYVLFSRVMRRRDFEDRVEVDEEMGEEGLVEGNSPRADALTEDFANQLEVAGLWDWSIFVLEFLELPDRREKAIKYVLTRNVVKITEDSYDFLVHTLKIPPTWVYAAQATAEQYNGDPWESFKLLIKAEMPNEAHTLFVWDLAPETIIKQDMKLLRRLLDYFEGLEAVAKWSEGGKIFAEYLECVEDVKANSLRPKFTKRLANLIESLPKLLGTNVSGSAVDVERIRKEMAGVRPNFKLKVCIAEMTSRLTFIASTLKKDLHQIKPAPMQEADKLVWLRGVNADFFEKSLKEACMA